MDASRVGRLRRMPMMTFQSAPRETVWPGVVRPEWHSKLHSPGTPVGLLLDRRALSGGLRFARPPAIGWQPFRLPVPSRAPVVPPSHNLWDSPH